MVGCCSLFVSCLSCALSFEVLAFVVCCVCCFFRMAFGVWCVRFRCPLFGVRCLLVSCLMFGVRCLGLLVVDG